MTDNGSERSWDLFISYASEDRAEVAEPLASTLSAFGLKVWFDKRELKLGDSLRRRIDEGISCCRYGVVILSPSFFAKHYPNRELDGLAQREVDGASVILPVWHDVTDVQVRAYSAPLADRVAARWNGDPLAVALAVIKTVRPELFEQIERALKESNKESMPLSPLHSGGDLAQVLSGTMAFEVGNDEPKSEEEMEFVAGFHQSIQDYLDVIDNLDAGDRVRMDYELSEEVRKIQQGGWLLFGRKVRRAVPRGKEGERWPVALLVLARKDTTSVFALEDGRFAIGKAIR